MTAATDIRIEAWYDQPREVVYEAWASAEGIATFFAVPPWTVANADWVAQAGRPWRVDFVQPDGQTYLEEGQFQEVVPHARLVFTLQQIGMGYPAPLTTVHVTFTTHDGGTRLEFVQSGLIDRAQREGNANGWAACLACLQQHLRRSSTA